MKKIIYLFIAILFAVTNLKAQYGTGADGSVTITAPSTIINNYYQVTAVLGTQIDFASYIHLQVDKKYLLYQSTGTYAGNWEIVQIPLAGNPYFTTNHYFTSAATTQPFGGGAMQLIEFPEYDNLTISPSGSITCTPYNATTGEGGLVFFMVKNHLQIDGVIDVSGKGFPANAATTGATGGVGGAGGLGGLVGGHGAVASVSSTGIGGGGNGGYAMANGASSSSTILPTYSGCGTIASNATVPTPTIRPTLLFGACGYSGKGGNSGQGAGGGGGGAGAVGCNNGGNGGAGGNGGNGGIGGNGGGIIFIFAKDVDYGGTNNLLAKGNNGTAATAGTSAGNGGNGGNGCGTCTTGGGGGGTGADGGNGGNGGSGGAAGFIYIRKSTGTALTPAIYKLTGGAGASGGAGGGKGYHGTNAPLAAGGFPCPGGGTSGPGGGGTPAATCDMNVCLTMLQNVGACTSTLITNNPAVGVFQYICGTDTVNVQAIDANTVLITTSNALGEHYGTMINNSTTSPATTPIITTVIQQILAGTSGYSWASASYGSITAPSGTLDGVCQSWVRATAADGNDGLSGDDGTNGGDGDVLEDDTPPCVNATGSGISDACGTNTCDPVGFFNSQADPVDWALSPPVVVSPFGGDYAVTSTGGCSYTYHCDFFPATVCDFFSITSTQNTTCGLNNGSVSFYASTVYCNSVFISNASVMLIDASGNTVVDEFGNPIYSTTGVFYNLAPGDYSVYFSSYSGGVQCPKGGLPNSSFGFTILPSTKPSTALTIVQPTCAMPMGSVTATVTNGIAPYNYNWSDGSTGSSINSTGGSFTLIVTDAEGCKDTVTATLNALGCCPTSTKNTVIACETYNWAVDGNTYTTSGIYTNTSTNTAGCAHIDSLVLTISTATISTTKDTICNNLLPYTWNGLVFSAADTQTATLVNSKGCDSLATLILTVKDTSFSVKHDTICTADLPYYWNGIAHNISGTYTTTGLTNVVGCDSAATVILYVNDTCPPPCACNPLIFHFNTPSIKYTIATVAYTYDSIIHPVCGSTLTDSLKCNRLYTFNIGVTYPPSWVGTCPASLVGVITQGGVVIASHTFAPHSDLEYTFTECGNYCVKYYLKIGTTICDSCEVCFFVKCKTSTVTNQIACNNFIWNSINYTTSGVYTHTTTIGGCPQIDTLNLTIIPSPTATINAIVCADKLPYVPYYGTSYGAAGTYTHTSTSTSGGCDTIITLNLTVTPNPTRTDNKTVCANKLPYSYYGHTYSTAGTYTGIIGTNTTGGCDTLITLVLSVTPNPTRTDNITICSTALPYTTHGCTFTAAGTCNYVATNTSGGCDTLVTLNLTATTCPPPCTSCDPAFNFTSGSTVMPSSGGSASTFVCSAQNNKLDCNKPYSFYISYNNPYIAPCIAKDSAVLTSGSTVVSVNPNASVSSPLNYTFTASGTYCIIHYLTINGKVCRECRVCFIVTCPISCNCTNVSFVGNPNVSWGIPKKGGGYFGYSLSAPCNTSLAKKLSCNTPHSFGIGVNVTGVCAYTLETTLNANSATGAVLASQTNTSSTAPLNYTFTSAGIYCVTFKLYVNGILCNTCTMCFTVCCNVIIIGTASPAEINGSAIGCKIGATTQLKHDSTGGTWESSDTSVARVDAKGNVAAIANGVATIIYVYPSKFCGWHFAAIDYNVDAISLPIASTGANSVCAGDSVLISNATPIPAGGKGLWSIPAGSATINNSGMLSATSMSTAKIRYTVSNAIGCSNYIEKSIVINALPNVPSITYASLASNPKLGAPNGGFCVGKVFGLIGNPSGGIWSATGIASITSNGVVQINSAGLGSINYKVTNSNGCSNSRTLSGSGYICAARGTVYSDNSESKSEFSVYPNPAKSCLNVSVSQIAGIGKIEIVDILGRTIKSSSIGLGVTTLDVTGLNKGLYSIILITNNSRESKKFVVE